MTTATAQPETRRDRALDVGQVLENQANDGQQLITIGNDGRSNGGGVFGETNNNVSGRRQIITRRSTGFCCS